VAAEPAAACGCSLTMHYCNVLAWPMVRMVWQFPRDITDSTQTPSVPMVGRGSHICEQHGQTIVMMVMPALSFAMGLAGWMCVLTLYWLVRCSSSSGSNGNSCSLRRPSLLCCRAPSAGGAQSQLLFAAMATFFLLGRLCTKLPPLTAVTKCGGIRICRNN
jgi:hypothetical protein